MPAGVRSWGDEVLRHRSRRCRALKASNSALDALATAWNDENMSQNSYENADGAETGVRASAAPGAEKAAESTLVSFDSRKLYYGFPIYVLTFRDPKAKSGWSMTTGSSSYSLGWMATFGVWGKTNAAHCIVEAGECTLSLVTRELMPVAERLGSVWGSKVTDKIEQCGATAATLPVSGESPHPLTPDEVESALGGEGTESLLDAPDAMRYLAGSPIVLDLKVESQTEFDGYVNFVTRVRGRYVDGSLIAADGTFLSRDFSPVSFMGDIAKNVYRFPSDEVKGVGDFSRQS